MTSSGKKTLGLMLLLVGWLGLNSQQEITVRIREGMPMIPVAMPDFTLKSSTPEVEEIRRTIYNTLWQDLEFSRIFRLVPREHYSYIAQFQPDRINFKDWASIQASILVTGQIEASGNERVLFVFEVHEVNSAKRILSRNLGGKKEYARLIAHRMADDLLKLFGEKPIFASKIVYVHGNQNDQEIQMMDYDGQRPTPLTANKVIDLLPSWSRDNEKILYTSYKRMSADLFLFDIYSGTTSLISSGGSNYAADWSPVDDRILFTSSKKGNAEIYMRNIKTGEEKQLTFNPAIDTSPSWSPNGREIAFVSSRSGSPQIYLMDAEGANVRRITYEGSYHDSPAWSPDGSRIAFVSRIENRFDIYMYHIQTNEFTKLTENAGRNENPTWSPDSRHLAFSSNRSGAYQIYLTDYDGKNVRAVTSQGENRMPRWQKSVP